MSDRTTSSDNKIRQVLDKQEILEVLYRYCQGCDRADAELLRTCFHPESVTDHAGVVMPSHDWVAGAMGFVANRVAVTHMITNPLIQVSGDRAISDCHFVAYNRERDEAGTGWREMIVKGRYLDRFERRGGQWKIIHRLGIHDLERVLEAPASADQISGGPRSGKAPDDPFYALAAAFAAGG